MGCGASAVKGRHGEGLSSVLPEPSQDMGKTSSSSGGGIRQKKSSKTVPISDEDARERSSKSLRSQMSRSEKHHKRLPQPRRSMGPTTSQGSRDPGREREGDSRISEEERRFLHKVLSKHFLFCSLESSEMQVLMEHMERQIATCGQVIFQQGDKGDKCFLIMAGQFQVSIDDRVLKQLKQKQTFGELALLYNVNRTATITCTQNGVLWALGEHQFREAMKSLNNQQKTRVKTFLQGAPRFSTLSVQDRDEIADCGTVQVFQKGDIIIREGEVGDWMFVIMEGTVQLCDPQGRLALRQSGTILGAVGIMCTKQHLVGAKASEQVTCLALGRNSLAELKPEVQNMLRRCAIRSLVGGGFSSSTDGDLEFFGELFDNQQELVLDKLEEVIFDEGEELLSQGSPAQFFVVTDGEVAVIQNAMVAKAGGSALHLKEFAREVLRPGMTYGGKAILDSIAMKESLFALQQTRIFRIGAEALSIALGGPISEVLRWNEIKKVLSDVFLFKNLHEDQIDKTIRSLKRKKYAAGAIVVQQGDEAKHFFLIQSGTIKVMKDGQKLRTLGRWDYLGERGLLLQEKRSATCEAETSCTCLMLEAQTFGDIVGMFRRDLEHRMYLQDLDITMPDLELQAIVGRGTFGIVKLVNHHKDKSKTYALKCVEKQQVVEQRQEKQIVVERETHAQCYHPCVVQFIKTFQDHTCIYFLTEFLGGGDLFYVIREIGSLSKEQAQFYSGSIILALEYLHGRGIMYRDLKPENVLLDFRGNAKLVDFGCCKKALRSSTLVGTPEYLAPEVILGKGYTSAVDWWALGVMLHEFVVGPLPFGRDSSDQLELFREILEAPLRFPGYVSDETAVSLISGLLERGPELRLGAAGRAAKDLQDHRYFLLFDWRALLGHYMTPPWVPDIEKIKQNWEMHSGERLCMNYDPSGNDKHVEPGMEWCAVF